MSRIQSALAFAKTAHDGQVRKFTGLPYITHPVACAALLDVYKPSHESENLVIALLLHDTVEDGGVLIGEIESNFGPLVAELVQALTSDKAQVKAIGKTAYLSEKMLNMRSWALTCKLIDRLHNCSDFRYVPDHAWVGRYAAETLFILDALESARVLTRTHQRIIADIRAVLSR